MVQLTVEYVPEPNIISANCEALSIYVRDEAWNIIPFQNFATSSKMKPAVMIYTTPSTISRSPVELIVFMAKVYKTRYRILKKI